MPPLEKVRPDDHFMMLLEGDETPMHIGALLLLEVPDADRFPRERTDLFDRLRDRLIARLPRTPLVRELRHAPLSFDSDVWIRAEHIDLGYHFRGHHTATPMSDSDLATFVEREVMTRLDLTRPPFVVHIFDNVEGGRAALYVKVHHCVTDGIGFQTILGLLSDDESLSVRVPPLPAEDELPTRHLWLANAVLGFRRQRRSQPARDAAKARAIDALRAPEMQRAKTPVLSLSGPTSPMRAYATITLSFTALKSVAGSLGATVNDMFLALAGTTMREYLFEIGDLPETPLVANAARSYRRLEHGAFGNRIVAINPHLGTHLADPLERLRAIQESMAVERRRTPHDEALLNQPETPFGPRVRREKFSARRSGGGSILPGNISVSNVPGPVDERYIAGFRQIANYPAPLLGSGRAINFTARRNADSFDVGLMVDAAKIPDVKHVASLFRQAFATYLGLG